MRECTVQSLLVFRISQCVLDDREDGLVLEQTVASAQTVSHNYVCIHTLVINCLYTAEYVYEITVQ